MKNLLKKAAATLLCTTLFSTATSTFAVAAAVPETVVHMQLISADGVGIYPKMKVQKYNTAKTVTAGVEFEERKSVMVTTAKREDNGNKGNGLNLNFDSTPYPDGLKSGDCLEFDFYIEDASVLPKIEMHTKDTDKSSGTTWSRNDYDIPENVVTAGSWSHVKIDLDERTSGNDLSHYENLCQFNFSVPAATTTDVTFYVTNMYISRTVVRATAECASAKIDNSGNAVINLIFSKPLDDATVLKEAFTIENLTCTDAVYSAVDDSVTLTFAEMLEFPKEYTLSIADTVTDSDGYAVDTTPVVFITENFQSELSVKSLVADTSTAAQDGVVKISAEAATIYRKNADPLKFKAIAAIIRDGNILTMTEGAEVTAADRGQSVSVPQLTITDESLKTLDGTEEIQLFLVSAEDGLMPLAEVKSIKQ